MPFSKLVQKILHFFDGLDTEVVFALIGRQQASLKSFIMKRVVNRLNFHFIFIICKWHCRNLKIKEYTNEANINVWTDAVFVLTNSVYYS